MHLAVYYRAITPVQMFCEAAVLTVNFCLARRRRRKEAMEMGRGDDRRGAIDGGPRGEEMGLEECGRERGKQLLSRGA